MAKKRNLLRRWLLAGWDKEDQILNNVIFTAYVVLLLFIIIWNRHSTEKLIIESDSIDKELQIFIWEHTSLKAELNHKSKQSEVAKQVETLGLKELRLPPNSIILNEEL